jgi:hypothetical protein
MPVTRNTGATESWMTWAMSEICNDRFSNLYPPWAASA